jgi:hypothetical protein
LVYEIGETMDPSAVPNFYYHSPIIEYGVSHNQHRDLVGGLWDEVGKLQFDFLRMNGLSPASKLIDIGCGCLRGGVHFVDFLDSGNYYGIDISEALLSVGYHVELHNHQLQSKLPYSNLVCDGNFQFSKFPVTFDIGIAQSLFTHLTANYVRLCLLQLTNSMELGANLFATFFLVPDGYSIGAPFDHPHGVRSFDDRDPYHYRFNQVVRLSDALPWHAVRIGSWGHPRDQQMVLFRHLTR